MKILFSPIGNTDPWRNDRDGALLNIVRTYQPDIVQLFFTESIWEGNSRFIGQKNFNWNFIINKVSPDTDVRVKVNNIGNEHDFDAYKDIFHLYLSELENEYPDAELLLNVTSGTPQMEATLCLEYITYPKNKTCIQVSTPTSSSNAGMKYAKPEDQVLDLEIVNQEESLVSSRCKEINILSFREAMLRSQLKGIIYNYDYEAALQLLDIIPKGFRNKKKLRKVLLNLTDKIKLHEPFDDIKEEYKSKDVQKALFHTLLLGMRHRRGDVAETLIRIKAIAEFIVEKYIGKQYPGLIYYKNDKPYLDLDYNPIFIKKYKEYISHAGHYLKEKENLLSFPMYRDILTLLETDGDVLKNIHFVNNINNLRNQVAHNLQPLNLYQNKNERNIDLAVKAVENLLLSVFPEVDNSVLNYFDQFNERIKEFI